jgi:hypothetical protein
MKLFIRKMGGGSQILLAGLATAAFISSAAGSSLVAQTINPLNNPAPTANTASTRPSQLPWIAEVTKMADAGVAPDVMEAYVKSAPSYSILSVDDILYLKSHGIADNVVAAMIQHGASGQQAAAAVASAPQYAPPAQYYSTAPAQSYYPASDYAPDQSSVYVIPQYYPNYYYPYPYYYSYYPFYYWNYGYRWRFHDFDHDRFGRRGFDGRGFGGRGFDGRGFSGRGFGRPGFNGGIGGGHPFAPVGGRSFGSSVSRIGFHGGGMGMRSVGGGMHGGGGGMGMHGGGGFRR